MGNVKMRGVAFSTFQLSGATYQWWQAYKEGILADASLITWTKFLEMFLREFVPQTHHDAWRTEFKQLRHGTMTVSEYAIRFSELSRHVLALVSKVKERVCRFIERLNYVLFDPGSTCSYVSSYFALYLDISRDSLSSPVYVSMPIGDSIMVDRMYRSCLIVIGGFETRVDLLLLNMDCHAKNVTLAMPGFPRSEWRGTLDYIPSGVLSFLKAHRMVDKGCEAYLPFVRDVSDDTSTIELVPIVRDFPNVLLADLPGIPPDRDIDLGIDMLPGTQPISIPSYRMAPVELNELQEQLQ
ncbi:uncharacterized protein [Nicotiana tomentosiformis]|uniref:uncharacterized protein n=1 Tax=Nicotiana tomentosiformis TaxID=4098 RepID=UPI00388C6D28